MFFFWGGVWPVRVFKSTCLTVTVNVFGVLRQLKNKYLQMGKFMKKFRQNSVHQTKRRLLSAFVVAARHFSNPDFTEKLRMDFTEILLVWDNRHHFRGNFLETVCLNSWHDGEEASAHTRWQLVLTSTLRANWKERAANCEHSSADGG